MIASFVICFSNGRMLIDITVFFIQAGDLCIKFDQSADQSIEVILFLFGQCGFSKVIVVYVFWNCLKGVVIIIQAYFQSWVLFKVCVGKDKIFVSHQKIYISVRKSRTACAHIQSKACREWGNLRGCFRIGILYDITDSIQTTENLLVGCAGDDRSIMTQIVVIRRRYITDLLRIRHNDRKPRHIFKPVCRKANCLTNAVRYNLEQVVTV